VFERTTTTSATLEEVFDVAALGVEKPRSERTARVTPDDTSGTSSAARPTTRPRHEVNGEATTWSKFTLERFSQRFSVDIGLRDVSVAG
jgi:hypothetical protein